MTNIIASSSRQVVKANTMPIVRNQTQQTCNILSHKPKLSETLNN